VTSNEDAKRLALLDSAEFTTLFVEELGWERPKGKPQDVNVDDEIFRLDPVAEYRGVRVWACPSMPDRRVQRAIDAQMKTNSIERLLIFYDSVSQQWKWPLSSDSQGRGSSRIVTHEHFTGNQTEALLQRLRQIEIAIGEQPSVVDVVGRLRRAFDADAVTKSFYKRFSDEAGALSGVIKGIKHEADRDWYAALLLNRLMFIYFMQRKGFMDSDIEYLQNRLKRVREVAGPDKFFEFYTDFLLPLFHDGLGSPERPVGDSDLARLIGDIPYVNGGIFSTHPLEEANQIAIPDGAFQSIFDLFDQYQWHLDDRPTGKPNEINPDVLGYIFEQFINNKEQGAYYTKEDVTYFMTAATVLPSFLERLVDATDINPWARVHHSPERYMWQSLLHGEDEPLPGLIEDQASGFPRPAWNELATDSHALPGETWWEVVARRKQAEALRDLLVSGAVTSVEEAIQSNLDLETVVVDAIDALDTPKDVVAAWNALTSIKIIDPTCGSGAFLFAALKILELLYAAILDAADRHVGTSNNQDLRDLVAEASAHPSRQYFCLKHAAIKNLYGVDLMNEAVEIARLRLFLKLVSTVTNRDDLEPLPDLDFNIKPGNILVGARTIEDIVSSTDTIFAVESLDEVTAAAEQAAKEYTDFQSAMETGDETEIVRLKGQLRQVLSQVRDTVDKQYFENQSAKTVPFAAWRKSSQPFHWFIEFPEVFSRGGFDVVVGNPPYVAKRKITSYTYSGFYTNDLPDVYAPCVERATDITHAGGRFAMILPISSQFGNDFVLLREYLISHFSGLWVSAFSRNPSALFSAGLGVRSTIVVGSRSTSETCRSFTKTHRWVDGFRPALFETLQYFELSETRLGSDWARPTSLELTQVLEGLLSHGARLGQSVVSSGSHSLGFKQTTLYYLSVFDEDPPAFELDCSPTQQPQVSRISFDSETLADAALAVLLSKLSLVWWYCTGDDFHTTQDGLKRLPVSVEGLPKQTIAALSQVGTQIRDRLPDHVMFTKYAGKWMGNYVISELRDLTDRADEILAAQFGYRENLDALEHAYFCVFKPTGDRPGTLRESPCKK